MSSKRVVLSCGVFLCLLIFTPTLLHSQATTSGTVIGTVIDPSKAAVPNAEVTLTNQGTNLVLKTLTNASGVYLFSAVPAGDYTLRCSTKGFRTTEIHQVHVEVLKSYTYDIGLEVGSASMTVEVVSMPMAELQTTDASIGVVLGGDMLEYLPAQGRSITSVMLLQPAVSPNRANQGDTNGGGVAGALPDQTTFYVDGGDATSDLEGTNNYVSPPGEPQPAPFIAVPAETVQEFRMVTASPTSSFVRSQGGEVAVVTKSGTNTLHGSAYEYYYGSGTSGNTWQLNSLGIHRPHAVNNRFGASTAGRILKDKLFFYGNYEGRRFYQNATISTTVPTNSARQGILRFKDAAGNIIGYNFNPANGPLASACGPSGTGACDPRNLGFSTLIQSYFQLLPPANDSSQGDGLNSSGFTTSYAQPIREDLAVGKLDYNINKQWTLSATFHYNRYRLTTTDQFDIVKRTLISTTPVEPRFVTFTLTGQMGAFNSQTHGSFMRDWWGWNRAALAPQLPGTAGTLQISGEARLATGAGGGKAWADPINFNTQNARGRLWAGKDYFVAQDSTWLHGSHTIQFGGGYYFWNLIHQRTDVVTGGLTGGPIYWVGQTVDNGGTFINIPASQAPLPCVPKPTPPNPVITTNCLPANQLSLWNVSYATLLGLVDRSSQVGTRDGNFIANPLGSPLIDHVHTHTFEVYFQDIWKVKPSFTLTYGLSYGVSFAPQELNGKQVLQVFAASNQPVSNLAAFFQQRNAALTNGGFFASGLTSKTDTTFGFSPIRHIPGRNSSGTTSWRDLGPRVAAAWQVPFSNRIFGKHQTVIRAGYSLLWNRTSGVGEVLTPLLGNGLASVDICAGPQFSAGSTTATCSGASIDAGNGFRMGTDGSTVPLPAFTNAAIPLVQTLSNGNPSPFAVSRASIQDPNVRLPYSHNVSLDIQRAFPGNWFLDAGYIGRFSRNLWQNVDVNAADPFAKTPACSAGAAGCVIPTSGETLAQAFDAISTALRAGVLPANVTPQPFFENAPYGCAGCTATLAKNNTAQAKNGALSSWMLNNADRNLPRPLDPLQFSVDNITTDGGQGTYNGMFVTVRKAFSQGLNLIGNYTWSHSTGTLCGFGNYIGQQYTFYSVPTPFDYGSGTASCNGDRRHVINASWYYLLPFGKGRHFTTSSAVFDRIVGGWYVSGIWTKETGLPTCVNANGDFGAPNGATCAVGASFFGMASRHRGVFGSGGIGTNTGTGLNLFADPAAVYNALSRPLLSVNKHPVQENLNLPRSWNVDLSVGKNILATERYKMVLTADFFNAFNHPLFGTSNFGTTFTPGSSRLSLNSPQNFGVLSTASNDPRSIQLGLRFEF